MMFHEITMKPMNLPWHFRWFSRRPTPPRSRLSTCPAGENHHFGGPARRRRAAAGPFSVEDSRFFVGIDMLFNGFFMGCNVFFLVGITTPRIREMNGISRMRKWSYSYKAMFLGLYPFNELKRMDHQMVDTSNLLVPEMAIEWWGSMTLCGDIQVWQYEICVHYNFLSWPVVFVAKSLVGK